MKKTLTSIAKAIASLPTRAARALAGIRSRIVTWAVVPLLLLTGALAAAQAPAVPPQFGPDAINTILLLQQEKAQLAPHEQKIDSRLRRLIDNQRAPPKFPGLAGLASAQPNADGTIVLDIDTFAGSDVKALIDAVGAAGGQVLHASTRYRSARVRLQVSAITGIAMLPGVRVIYPKHDAMTNKINTSEGDTTHRAAAARAFFGFDGTGVKACVLSDGVDSLAVAQASGDLPPFVDVLPGQAGSGDEGTAMLEIVHDLVPGASLGFATAFTSAASFAQNIIDLKNAGCHIIVDDVTYFIESPFQDNNIADAVNQVSAVGVLFFSSAGNSGNLDDGTAGTWEGNFNPNGTIPSLPAGTVVHNFGGGGQSDAFTAASNNPITLHWTDTFGTSANDYDLYVLNSTLTAVLDSSTNVQNGVGDPFEIVGSVGYAAGDRVVVLQHSGAQLRMINVATNRGRLTFNTSGVVKGHNGAANTVSVAATPAAGAFGPPPNPTGPFPGPHSAANLSERFTSDGPRRTFFDFAGNLVPGAPPGNFLATGGVVLQKPDITAADGVQTSAPGFNPFYGTSASAPHAAAIAALVKHAFPAKTAAQIKAAMIGSAFDIEGAGWDRNTGFGIVMAYETLQAQGAVPSAVLNVGTVTPTQVAGNGNASVDPGEDWKFDIVLNNTGGAPATAIVATLVSNTPGIVVTSSPVFYPNITNGGSASNPVGTPFRFSVTTAACGTAGSFTLTVTYSGGTGAPLTMNIPITLGSLGSTSTFAYAGPVVPIADGLGAETPGATATVNLTASGLAGLVGDVNFRFDGTVCSSAIGATTVGLDHTWVGDLVVNLVAPDNTVVPVVTRMSGGNNSGNNFCQSLLDDSSAGAVIDTLTSASAPFTGSFKPSAPLAGFVGKNGNGTWKLQATDYFIGDTGNIRAFSVVITPLGCAAVSNPTAFTATKTVSGTFTAGSTVAYTVTLTNTGTGTQVDNPGDEFTDTLPAQLTLQTVSASRGAASSTGNTAKWNGSIAGGGSVTITITASINIGTTGMTVSNQGTVHFDPNHSGTNGSTVLTDDPAVVGTANPTVFMVAAATGTARTFVSSTGNDANPCTLSSPCRMLSAALLLTAAAGEIVVLDSAGYGPVVIDRPVTIVAPPGVYAGISVPSGHGIDVDPGPGEVVLRGLNINGLGGDFGVNFMSGDALYIENCVITGFTNTGLNVITPAAASVFVRDSTIRDNFYGAAFGSTSGATGALRAHVERSRIENNATVGIGIIGGSASATIDDSLISGGTWGLYVNPSAAGALARVEARGATIVKNSSSGVRVGGIAGTTAVTNLTDSQLTDNGIGLEMLTGGTAYVSNTTITRNTTGITTVSGNAISLQDNRLLNNGSNGAFSSSVPKQ